MCCPFGESLQLVDMPNITVTEGHPRPWLGANGVSGDSVPYTLSHSVAGLALAWNHSR